MTPVYKDCLPQRRALVLLLLLAFAPTFAQTGPRLQPPSAGTCPRDRLTLYSGSVTHYTRGQGRTTLRIGTDWQTVENIVITHPGSDDPSRWFLMQGQPFAAADWARIEQAPGQLRQGTRAAAWVCDDGRNPTLDWNPPREP